MNTFNLLIVIFCTSMIFALLSLVSVIAIVTYIKCVNAEKLMMDMEDDKNEYS